MPALCRDCGNWWDAGTAPGVATGSRGGPCPACRSTRVIAHADLGRLAIAHLDCDAFYATIEKRDDPSIRGKPVIVGGGHRGVVSAACYIARINGVRSAMPMFEARKRCPDAVVIRPNMAKYAAVGRDVRRLMQETTPLVEPLSIDEAFLDLSGTETLHGVAPARTLVRLVRRIEDELGVTASIGLSYNKSLAKIASEMDKPRGFAVIGPADAAAFLADKPVRTIFGVGAALGGRLERDGIRVIGDLRAYDEETLVARYGAVGRRLRRFADGEDDRAVNPEAPPRNVSTETTFDADIADAEALSTELWRLTEKLSARLKRDGLAGGTVTLKLKTAGFRTITRSRRMPAPSRYADDIFRHADDLLRAEADGRHFRLIGVGVSKLVEAALADTPDLADPGKGKRIRIETAVDALRDRFGREAVIKGRGFRTGPE